MKTRTSFPQYDRRSPSSWVRLAGFCILLGAVVQPLFQATAATFTWDASGLNAGSPTDGAGAWSTTGTNWSNGSADAPWNNADVNDNAVFGVGNGAAGTVTVGAVSVGNITFNAPGSGSYTLSGGTITLTSGTVTTNASSATINSTIAGSAGLVVNGTRQLTLGSANSYTGGTTLSSGTLSLGNAGALSSGTLTVTGGTLVEALGAAVSNNIVVSSGTTTLQGGVGGSFMLLSGAITGGGTIQTTVSLGDNIRFSGNYSGFTGTFILQSSGGAYLNSANSTSAGAAWQVNALTYLNAAGTFNFGSLSGNGSLQASSGAAVISVGALNQSSTFGGSIVNAGGTGSLIKVGTGMLTLSGNNSYSGGTTLSSGTLSATSSSALGSGTLTLSGGTLVSAVGATLSNNIVVTASTTNTLQGGGGASFMALSGAITGSGTIQTTASLGDNIRFSGNDSGFTGTFILQSSGGAYLNSANSASAGAAWQVNALTYLNAAGTFNFGSLSGNGSLQASSGAALISVGALNQNSTFGGSIINAGGTGSLIKVGTGMLTLSGNNSYSGGTTLSSGTLSATSSSALGSGTLTLSGGTLVSAVGATLSNNIVVTASTTNTLQGGGGASFMALSGAITGSGTIQTTANLGDNIRFSGNDSGFTGTFILQSSGGAYLNSANSASAGAAWQVNALTYLNAAGTFNFGSLSGNGSLQASSGAAVISVGALNQSSTFGGTIVNAGGTGILIVAGTGTLTLTGANTYTGGTTINSGATLQIGNGGTTGSILSTGTIADNGNLAYDYSNTSSVTVPSGTNITGSGNISATAENITLSGTIVVGGSQSYTEIGGGAGGQGIIITPSATTSLSGSSISLVGDIGGGGGNGTLQLNTSASNGPISLNISLGRSGVFNPSAAVIATSGTGAINIVGTNSGGWMGTPVTLTGAVNISAPVNDNSTLTINPTVATASSVSGILSGGMSLVEGGPGTLTITATNTYTGSTAIYAGTLQIGNGGSIASTSGVSGSSGSTLAFNRSDSVTWSKATSGGVGIAQVGGGTLTLSGNNLTYTGLSSASAGTLIVAGAISGNVAANGGTLVVNSTAGGNGSVSGGTLGGEGIITGNVTVGTGSGAASSSIIAPSAGGGIAAQTQLEVVGNLTLNSDAAFQLKLDSANAGYTDSLYVSGTLTLTGSPALSASDLSNVILAPGSTQYVIADALGGITGAFANDPQGGLVQIGVNYYSIDYTADGDTEIVLTSAIPEPGAWAMMLAGLGMLIGLQRSRRRGGRG